jgi:hypothetical protein
MFWRFINADMSWIFINSDTFWIFHRLVTKFYPIKASGKYILIDFVLIRTTVIRC